MNEGKSSQIPIITYHSIDRSGSVISTSPDIFRAQMRFFRENDYRAISLEKLIGYFREKNDFPKKSVVLTFDDGFENFYTDVFPILQNYEFSATVFIVTDFCGKTNNWQGNITGIPCAKLLNWQEIKELSDAGIEIGAHSKTHPRLSKLSLLEAEKEIADSKKQIEDRIGKSVGSFAYPYGDFNHCLKELTAQHFAAACSVKLGKMNAKSDFYALERLDSFYLKQQQVFHSIFDQKFDFYIGLRKILRDLKSLAVSG